MELENDEFIKKGLKVKKKFGKIIEKELKEKINNKDFKNGN
jgi:hypothetical protein